MYSLFISDFDQLLYASFQCCQLCMPYRFKKIQNGWLNILILTISAQMLYFDGFWLLITNSYLMFRMFNFHWFVLKWVILWPDENTFLTSTLFLLSNLFFSSFNPLYPYKYSWNVCNACLIWPTWKTKTVQKPHRMRIHYWNIH